MLLRLLGGQRRAKKQIMDNDYTPHDAGNNTKQVGDKFYKSPEEIAMKHEEVLLDLHSELKDEDNIPF